MNNQYNQPPMQQYGNSNPNQFGYPQPNMMQQTQQQPQFPQGQQNYNYGGPSYPPPQQPQQLPPQPPQQQQQQPIYNQQQPQYSYNQNLNQQQPSNGHSSFNHPLAQPGPSQQQQQAQYNQNFTQSHAMTRPPYVDPETQITYPCNNPDFEGWLTKQSMWLKDWRRRYFILSGSKLFFAKNAFSAPHGMIDLSTATTVKSADIKSRKKNSFEISTHEMTYLMFADSEKEKDDWIGSVGRSIVRASGTFLTKNDAAAGGTATKAAASGSGVNSYGYGEDDDDDDEGVFENSDNHPYFW